MGTPVTTSGMSEKQVNRACEIFRAQLTSHAHELPSDAVQKVFGQPELGPEWLAVLRKRVEALVIAQEGASDVYELEVNYDDPQWQTIDSERYAFVGDVTVKDYPVNEKGTRKVQIQELVFDHDPTDQEVIDRMEQIGCRQPNRAEIETVIRKRYTSEQLK